MTMNLMKMIMIFEKSNIKNYNLKNNSNELGNNKGY